MARTKQTYRPVRPSEKRLAPVYVTVPLNKSYQISCVIKRKGHSTVRSLYKEFMDSPLTAQHAAKIREFIEEKECSGKALDHYDQKFKAADSIGELEKYTVRDFIGKLYFGGITHTAKFCAKVNVRKHA